MTTSNRILAPIIAKVSVIGKRSRAADKPMPAELSWITEVHKKIWVQEIIRPELFRRVEVTQADYTALQELLKTRHSDRDEPDYHDNDSEVLSVKLSFFSRSSK